jgi:peptidoglycan hydrolase-like protein with peptidoglycan-binding domain
VRRFRRLAQAYGAPGVSWWVWQHARAPQWTALGSAFEPIGEPRTTNAYPLLKYGYRSDQVIWAQQHLKALGLIPRVSGRFGSGTRDAVLRLQADNGLNPTGRIDAAVWQRLLAVEPAPVRWSR